ncbi:unnamed protein product [Rotaria magnacalcarata]|uniref:Uncharacterized protein n=1 Tax=Rotaria magnacalcarata TaxID=392030 RepID=A0A816SLC6_9BILA|nr:unnamed protein product [Rotaria magnacalcarata]CAF3974386.1 unnamed protein product [Rotaria magnacalcarata]
MNYLLIFSCLFATCLAVAYGQLRFSTSTGHTTGRPVSTTGRPVSTTGRPVSTTGRPVSTTGRRVSTTAGSGSSLKCVCSCCSGFRCKPSTLQSFVDTTCTVKACKEKCKVFEPKHCDHTIMGTNDAFCTV